MSDQPSPETPAQIVETGTLRRPRPRRWNAVIAAVAVIFTAGLVTGLVTSRDDGPESTLRWTSIDGGLEEAVLAVPLDHDDPNGRSIDLKILRRPADDPSARIGSMIVNPGGPGFGAAVMVTNAKNYFESELLARFDIIGMDPRGTGGSDPAIDCIDDYDDMFSRTDLTPADEAARQTQIDIVRTYAEGCTTRTGDVLSHMTTAATARDIDALRSALGESTITYFGMSYGCKLGATWATLFPDTVRAAVLDGCEDPKADIAETNRQQAAGFQASVEAFLAKCASAPDQCPIARDGDPTDALRRLWDIASTEGIASLPGRPRVNETVLSTAMIVSMYSEDTWPTFAEAIAKGLEGDGSVLTLLADAYYQRREDGTWGNELEAFSVISCMDNTTALSAEQQRDLNRELSRIAPLVYPEGIFTVQPCEYLPTRSEDPVTITGAGAPTLLVLGNTGDPATPFASTQRMAASLASAVLLTVESNNHGGYRTNKCVNDVVHAYLTDLAAPAPGKKC